MEKKIETKSQELIRRLKYNKSALFGLVIVIIIVLCALLANYIAPNDPNPSPPQLANKLKPGFWSEKGIEGVPLGTDSLGRCVLSRIIYGSRVSLSAGFVAVGIAMILGITFGVIAGYYGGWVDALIMRIVDIMFAFPALLLAIVIVAVIGQGLGKAMVAIGIVYTPQMARIIRSSVLYIKEMEYIEIQKAIGSSDWRVIFRHVLPNSIAPVIVYGTLMLASAILDYSLEGKGQGLGYVYFNVFSSKQLLDVAEHPEKYPYPVIVRIHGQYGDARKLSPDILKKDIIPRLDPGSVSF